MYRLSYGPTRGPNWRILTITVLFSLVSLVQCSNPVPAGSFECVGSTYSSVSLSWALPTGGTSPQAFILGYLGPATAHATIMNIPGHMTNVTTKTHPLSPGTNHTFSIRAYYSGGTTSTEELVGCVTKPIRAWTHFRYLTTQTSKTFSPSTDFIEELSFMFGEDRMEALSGYTNTAPSPWEKLSGPGSFVSCVDAGGSGGGCWSAFDRKIRSGSDQNTNYRWATSSQPTTTVDDSPRSMYATYNSFDPWIYIEFDRPLHPSGMFLITDTTESQPVDSVGGPRSYTIRASCDGLWNEKNEILSRRFELLKLEFMAGQGMYDFWGIKDEPVIHKATGAITPTATQTLTISGTGFSYCEASITASQVAVTVGDGVTGTVSCTPTVLPATETYANTIICTFSNPNFAAQSGVMVAAVVTRVIDGKISESEQVACLGTATQCDGPGAPTPTGYCNVTDSTITFHWDNPNRRWYKLSVDLDDQAQPLYEGTEPVYVDRCLAPGQTRNYRFTDTLGGVGPTGTLSCTTSGGTGAAIGHTWVKLTFPSRVREEPPGYGLRIFLRNLRFFTSDQDGWLRGEKSVDSYCELPRFVTDSPYDLYDPGAVVSDPQCSVGTAASCSSLTSNIFFGSIITASRVGYTMPGRLPLGGSSTTRIFNSAPSIRVELAKKPVRLTGMMYLCETDSGVSGIPANTSPDDQYVNCPGEIVVEVGTGPTFTATNTNTVYHLKGMEVEDYAHLNQRVVYWGESTAVKITEDPESQRQTVNGHCIIAGEPGSVTLSIKGFWLQYRGTGTGQTLHLRGSGLKGQTKVVPAGEMTIITSTDTELTFTLAPNWHADLSYGVIEASITRNGLPADEINFVPIANVEGRAVTTNPANTLALIVGQTGSFEVTVSGFGYPGQATRVNFHPENSTAVDPIPQLLITWDEPFNEAYTVTQTVQVTGYKWPTSIGIFITGHSAGCLPFGANISLVTAPVVPTVTIGPSPQLLVREGGSTLMTYVLDIPPALGATVSLTLSSVPAGLLVFNPSILNYTDANWNATQSVTVTAVDNTVITAAGSVSAQVITAVSGTDTAFNTITIPAHPVAIEENDARIVVQSSLSLVEGSSGDVKVTLSPPASPGSPVTVLISSSAGLGTLVVSDTTLSFTDTVLSHTVSIIAVGNSVIELTGPASYSILFSIDKGAADALWQTALDVTTTVTITDNDLRLTVAPVVDEHVIPNGGKTTLTVALTGAPTADLTITLSLQVRAPSTVSGVTLSTTSLVFVADTPVLSQSFDVVQDINLAGLPPTLLSALSFTVVTTDARLSAAVLPTQDIKVVDTGRTKAIITAVVPDAGPDTGGTAVTVLGSHFEQTTNVTLAGVNAKIVTQSASAIVCETNAIGGLAGDLQGYVTVITKQGTLVLTSVSEDKLWTYRASNVQQKISSFEPTRAVLNTNVTVVVQAANLGASRASVTAVHVASLPCLVSAWTSTELSCTLLTGSEVRSGPVDVTFADNTTASSAPDVFAVVASLVDAPAPAVSSFVPALISQEGGVVMSISGNYFGSYVRDVSSVTVAGIPCTPILSVAATLVTCRTRPAAAGVAGVVEVTGIVSGVSRSIQQARYVYTGPEVSDIRPRVVKDEGGTILTVRGLRFQGSTTDPDQDPVVLIGGVPCKPPPSTGRTFVSDTLIHCVAPPRSSFTNTDTESAKLIVIVSVEGLSATGDAISYQYGEECDPACPWNAQCTVVTPTSSECSCDAGFYGPPSCELRHFVVTQPSSPFTTEQGQQSTFQISLSHAPSSDVTISLVSSDVTEGTVSPDQIVFAPANWERTERVVITGVKDSHHDGDQPYVVSILVATADQVFADGAKDINPFEMVNRDYPPVIQSILPKVCALAGCNITVSGQNFISDTALYMDLPTASLTSSPESAGFSTNTASHRGKQLPTVRALADMKPAAEDSSGGATHPARLRSLQTPSDNYLHAFRDQMIVAGGPPQDGEGYHTLSVVSPFGTRASEQLYYTDDCPEEGFWGRGLDCKPCPEGGVCPGGYRIIAKPGYWNRGEGSGFVSRCDPPERCLGQTATTVECAPKYTGELCAECIDNHFETVNGECLECPPSEENLPLIIADVVLWTLVAVAHLAITDTITLSYFVLSVRTLQVVAGLGSLANSSLPSFLKTAYAIIHLFSGDYEFLKPDCFQPVPYYQRYWMKIMYNFAIFVPTWLFLSIAALVHRNPRVDSDDLTEGRGPNFYIDRLARSLLIWGSVIYFTATASAIETLSCFRLNDVYVMITSPAVRCYDGEPGQLGVTLFSVFVLCALTLGFPAAFSVYLQRNKTRMDDDRFAHRFSYLYEFYKPGFTTFWTIEFAIITVVASSNSALVPHPKYQFSICTVIFASKFIFIVWKQPFLDWITNGLHLVMSVVYLIILNISLIAKVVEVDMDKVNGPVGILILASLGSSIAVMCAIGIHRLIFRPAEKISYLDWAVDDDTELEQVGWKVQEGDLFDSLAKPIDGFDDMDLDLDSASELGMVSSLFNPIKSAFGGVVAWFGDAESDDAGSPSGTSPTDIAGGDEMYDSFRIPGGDDLAGDVAEPPQLSRDPSLNHFDDRSDDESMDMGMLTSREFLWSPAPDSPPHSPSNQSPPAGPDLDAMHTRGSDTALTTLDMDNPGDGPFALIGDDLSNVNSSTNLMSGFDEGSDDDDA